MPVHEVGCNFSYGKSQVDDRWFVVGGIWEVCKGAWLVVDCDVLDCLSVHHGFIFGSSTDVGD